MALSLITPDSLNLAQDYAGMGFGGTGSANQLDDYEEGTWTPVIEFGGNSVGQTYTSQVGNYVKTGNNVTVSCYVRFSNKGTSTGNSGIAGLPFSTKSQTNFYQTISVWHNNMAIGADYLLQPYISNNNDTITLYIKKPQDSTGINLSSTAFGNTTDIMVTLSYITD